MPEIGDRKKGYIWCACEECGEERWVTFRQGKPRNRLCVVCSHKQSPSEETRTKIGNALRGRPLSEETKRKFSEAHKGSKAYNWKGGRRKASGYIRIRVYPDDFFYPMARKDGYILEHRLVVARALGRNLQPWEIVHHKKDYAKDDNRYPETLQLVQEMQHNQITILAKLIKKLRLRVKELEVENDKLKRNFRKGLPIPNN